MFLLQKQIDRFWAKVNRNGPIHPMYGQCWEWIGRTLKRKDGSISYGYLDGYGYAHRCSWHIRFGSIPSKMKILHKCDNPTCVNPNHLFLGTQADNIRDMVSKRRSRGPSGEKCSLAKLSDEEVAKIRALYDSGEYTALDLATYYGVARCTISRAIAGITWSHVNA
jgi:hypothetical protein